MKKILAILIALLMTISLSACEIKPLPSQDTDDDIDTNITQTPEEVPEIKITADDLVGPWYLDSKNNDLDKFSELFPGYGEWGATMEIRSDGKIKRRTMTMNDMKKDYMQNVDCNKAANYNRVYA